MENPQKRHYICPMRCEDTKVYDQPGNCPVCKMKLVLVPENSIPEASNVQDDLQV